MKIQEAEKSHLEMDATESEESSVWAVVWASVLVSIPLGLCCYYLLSAG